MSYTSDELKAAVSELVQGTVSFKRDVLGPRDAGSSFDEIRELVNSTLLYESDSVFYLIYVASQALQKIVSDEIDAIDELLDAVDDLLKPSKPIRDISALAEVEVALAALDGAVSRSGRIGQSEYSRYMRSIERSKRNFGSVTKLTYTPRGASQAITDIVRPAAQARRDSTAHFGSLKTLHAKTVSRVQNILSAYDDFNLDELATLVSKTQVSRARSQVSSLYQQLESLPPEERTEYAREALLKVLANKSVVTAMTTAPEPGGTKLLQGYGAAATYRLTASGTGSAPVLEGTVSAPYPLKLNSAQNLDLTLNDVSPDLELDLLPTGDSFVDGVQPATLSGAKVGPFQLYGDLADPWVIHSKDVAANFGLTSTTNLFHMVVDGTQYEVALPTGAGSTPSAVASAIDSAIPTVSATEVAGAASGTRVQIEYDNSSPPLRYSERYMHVVEGANNAVLGPYLVGGQASPYGSTAGYTAFSTGWDSNLELKVKPNDNTGEETISLTAGSWTGDPGTSYVRTATEVRDMINASASGFSASLSGEAIVLTSIVEGEGSILTIKSAGMYTSGPKTNTGTPSYNGALTLGFYEGQEDRQRDVDGRVVVNLMNENATFSAEAQAKMLYTELARHRRATTHPTLTDRIVYDVGADPTGDWPAASELKLKVLSGDNGGTYQVNSLSWSSGTLTVELDRDLRQQNSAILHEIVIFKEVIQITSRDTSTAGLLEAKDSASYPARSVLGLSTGQIRGGVSKVYVEYNDPRLGWVPADLRQRQLKIGDLIRRLDTNVDVASIDTVADAKDGILGVTPEVDPQLTLGSAEGFNVQSVAYLSYLTFRNSLVDWWADLAPFEDDDLQYVDRLLSPVLLVDATTPRVNAVYSAVQELRGKLTGSGSLLEILQSFDVVRISQVDQVLQALLEQGHNRARALLISGDIAGYLATTKENSSYGKALMGAVSMVAARDVNEPTNLARHLSADRERVVAEWYDDKDPINDFSDVEDDLGDPAALDFWEGLD